MQCGRNINHPVLGGDIRALVPGMKAYYGSGEAAGTAQDEVDVNVRPGTEGAQTRPAPSPSLPAGLTLVRGAGAHGEA